eukprot:TRINITY_DN57349_c0_g1_i1.p2 TRINITY_DN57349_c0_g1~~TRINITY_DN57349_c0_g1_i1.p2  ORF type:complete len:154 (-),score=41.88 TRINITY_DN57349_c0_g1_i1:119-580(-)
MSSGAPGKKLSQAELLQALSPTPFDMRNVVPKDAVVEQSGENRWWRSSSPDREGKPDEPRDAVNVSASATRGVMGTGQREGPGCYTTSYRSGSGTAAHFKDEAAPPTISGYSGYIPGKIPGNCVGGTFNKSNEDANEHLQTTAQITKLQQGLH